MAKLKQAPSKSKEIFGQTILPKTKRYYEVLKEYEQLTDELRSTAGKIDYYQRESDFPEVIRLKKKQRNLEAEMMKIDEEMNSDDNKVTEQEKQEFRNEYKKEKSALEDNHTKLIEDFKKQADALAESYKKIVENRNEWGHRYERERFIKNNLDNTAKYFVSPDNELCKTAYPIKGRTSTIRDLFYKVIEPKMKKVELEDYQDYFHGKKKW